MAKAILCSYGAGVVLPAKRKAQQAAAKTEEGAEAREAKPSVLPKPDAEDAKPA